MADPALSSDPRTLLLQNGGAWNDPPTGRLIVVGSDAERDGGCPNPTAGYHCWNEASQTLQVYSSDQQRWIDLISLADLQRAMADAMASLNRKPWKASVKAASTANLDLSLDVEDGDTLDGVLLASGDRILLKNQAFGKDNGIYVVNDTGVPTRAEDADSGDELVSAVVAVEAGTVNGDRIFVCTNNTISIDVTAQVWTAFSVVAGALVAANNLSDLDSIPTARTTLDVYSKAESDAGVAAEAADRAAGDATTLSAAVGLAAGNSLIPRLMGKATLVAGTVAIVDHNAALTDIIVVSIVRPGGAVGSYEVAITAGDHFDINSSNALDASDVVYVVWTP